MAEPARKTESIGDKAGFGTCNAECGHHQVAFTRGIANWLDPGGGA